MNFRENNLHEHELQLSDYNIYRCIHCLPKFVYLFTGLDQNESGKITVGLIMGKFNEYLLLYITHKAISRGFEPHWWFCVVSVSKTH